MLNHTHESSDSQREKSLFSPELWLSREELSNAVKNFPSTARYLDAGAHVKGQMNRVLQRANKRSLFSESVVVRKTNTYIPESIPPQTFPTKRLQMMIISGTSPLKSKVLESNDIRAIYYHIYQYNYYYSLKCIPIAMQWSPRNINKHMDPIIYASNYYEHVFSLV